MEYDSDFGFGLDLSYDWCDDYNDTGWLVLSHHPVFCKVKGSTFLTHKLRMRQLAHNLIDGDSVRLVRRVLNLNFEN